MTQTSIKSNSYRSSYQALEQEAAANGPGWLRDLRSQAWSRFNELGFPTARRGNEKWKYTNVRPLAAASFDTAESDGPESGPQDVDADAVRRIAPWHDHWNNLVFLDGHYADSLSNVPANGPQNSNGVIVTSLADAIASGNHGVQKHLGKHASFDDDGFTALNTALLQDGAFVHLPGNCRPTAPLHLIFVTTGQRGQMVSYPRTLVIAGPNSRATILETYVTLSGDRYFTNAVTEFVLEDGAEIDHYRLLLESSDAFHVGSSRVYQGKDSTMRSASFAKGAAMARHDLQVLQNAPGAFCSLHGLYMTTGNQHIDNLVNIDHAMPNTKSRLFYKGILDGKSKAVFGGTVLVRKDAQKADARQTDKNLLLSHEAEVDSKPSLLIYADDVQCAHGATAGHIDQGTLFYMQSRGLDKETASRMLIHAFANEIIETVELESLREYLDGVFLAAIPTKGLQLGGGA